MEHHIATEADLSRLVGQAESGRMEFKESRLLLQENNKVAEDLSREISAFANSEGGTLVIGIKERKEGKMRVADDVDEGSDPKSQTRDWLQQIVHGNVSPYLPGLAVRAIPLSGTKNGRVAFAITIPKGSTAYQAKDKKYYGRSESEIQALPDHEIRLRMMMGRTARARVEIYNCNVLTPEEARRIKHGFLEDLRREAAAEEFPSYTAMRFFAAKESLESGKVTVVEYTFQLAVRNTGEITIRNFLLELRPTVAYPVQHLINKEWTDLSAAQRTRFPPASAVSAGVRRAEECLFPGDVIDFPGHQFRVLVPADASPKLGAAILFWKVFLDDAPPTEGALALDDFTGESSEQPSAD